MMSASDRRVTFGTTEDEEKAAEKLRGQLATVQVKDEERPQDLVVATFRSFDEVEDGKLVDAGAVLAFSGMIIEPGLLNPDQCDQARECMSVLLEFGSELTGSQLRRVAGPVVELIKSGTEQRFMDQIARGVKREILKRGSGGDAARPRGT